MLKILLPVIGLLISANLLFAEIKMIQIKVLDDPNPELKYERRIEGGFKINDQTSYMLPVKNKRIEGFRMPFIKGFGHEVILVGPFLDMCGDIEILDSENRLIHTIRVAEFKQRAKDKFYFPQENRIREEGFVRFEIPVSKIRNIRTQNFKIKVGIIDWLDIVECKLVRRDIIEAIRITGDTPPTREVTSHNDVSTIKNTFNPDSEYNVFIRLKGGALEEKSYRIGNGSNEDLIYDFDRKGSEFEPCDFQMKLIGKVKKSKVVTTGDGIVIRVRAITGDTIKRRAGNGFMIALSDRAMGNLDGTSNDENVQATLTSTSDKEFEPDFWGPYVFARIAKDILMDGSYTDMGVIYISECKKLGGGPRLPSGTNPPISGGGDQPSSTTNDPFLLAFSLLNAFVHEVRSGQSDYFSNPDVCNFHGGLKEQVSQQLPLKLIIFGPSGQDFSGRIRVTFKRGSEVLVDRTINTVRRAAPGNEVVIEFQRPENRICSILQTNFCKRCANNQNGIPHWDDEGITVEVNHNGNVIYTYTIQEDN